jgi:hypothetical protein
MSESSHITHNSTRGISIIPSIPPTPLQELKYALTPKSGKDVFAHSSDLRQIKDVPKLADSMIVVYFDTESKVRDHDKLIEVGVVTFDSTTCAHSRSPACMEKACSSKFTSIMHESKKTPT